MSQNLRSQTGIDLRDYLVCLSGLPKWLSGKESTWQCRKLWFDPWVLKIPGEGNANTLQYSCLRNPMDRGAWQAIYSTWGDPKRVRNQLATK